ncbi:hypothetical protein RBS60_02345 [Sinomonas sp. ASV486]|uniref:hypothetical protein n=1 Tax=Sinomonas sp. ASV486 TaxID=3051170 RepID=UPI0027DB30D7|nr:hypothetical protein [Sinomonas sp. ASV486]MDQ4489035.1 hypothetical protein [Sinomonas sp. ASV486]
MAMKTFLMLWKPSTWPQFAEEIPQLQAEIRDAGRVAHSWSSGGRKHDIEPGDRIYLIRTGLQPWSVIASGTASSRIYQDPQKPYPNEVDVDWDHIVDQDKAMPIPDEDPELYTYVTKRQASGNELSAEHARMLAVHWDRHLHRRTR